MRPDQALTPDEVRARAEEIRAELERLLARRGVATRPSARQWRFLRHCLETLITGDSKDFDCDKSKATQYRFEVEDRLARYYANAGPPVEFAFALQHASHAYRGGAIQDGYPQSNGYVLLVSDVKGSYQTSPARETRALLERIVADAGDAEFKVYRSLPKLDLSPLSGIYVEDSPAYRRIRNVAEGHHHKHWTIANRNNPSTHRLITVKDIELKGSQASVRTEEYWYLRWWSLKTHKTTVIYNMRSFQTYVLVRDGDTWVVVENIYPPPRESAARRKWY